MIFCKSVHMCCMVGGGARGHMCCASHHLRSLTGQKKTKSGLLNRELLAGLHLSDYSEIGGVRRPRPQARAGSGLGIGKGGLHKKTTFLVFFCLFPSWQYFSHLQKIFKFLVVTSLSKFMRPGEPDGPNMAFDRPTKYFVLQESSPQVQTISC